MIFNRVCSRALNSTIKPLKSHTADNRASYFKKLQSLTETCKESRRILTARQTQKMMRHFESMLNLDHWEDLNHFSSMSMVIYLQQGDLRNMDRLIRKKLNQGKFRSQNILFMAKVLSRLKYDPDERDQQYNEFVKEALQDNQHTVKWSLFPQINLTKLGKYYDRQEAQNRFSQYLKKISEQPSDQAMLNLFKFYKNGLIHDFWSNNFRKQKLELPPHQMTEKLERYQNFDQCRPDIVPVPCQTTTFQSNTESKIELYLNQLGYIFQPSMQISGFQFDFIINRRVILEYNGYTHYWLNRLRELNTFQSFKFSRLKEMGYVVSNIDYWKWEDLITKEKQHQHLIEKIENHYVVAFQK